MFRIPIRLLLITCIVTLGAALATPMPLSDTLNKTKGILLIAGSILSLWMWAGVIVQSIVNSFNENDDGRDTRSISLTVFVSVSTISGFLAHSLNQPIDTNEMMILLFVLLLCASLVGYLSVRSAIGAGSIDLGAQSDWLLIGFDRPNELNAFLFSLIVGAAVPIVMMIGVSNSVFLWFGLLFVLIVICFRLFGIRVYYDRFPRGEV